ncbi:hypothetical protein [Pseudotabrizicola algicola]|uniref:Uncharacterized protein n=1 Tax=Pseudotabrizicola algicola TaxID=2709381 RepID=A0A6B3RUI3_9RHOB|nr:hypothetical protein [Pseudotabrizicola algicola]NEX47595.1 hypothetical protein [Pseudotabrizicola algicola]
MDITLTIGSIRLEQMEDGNDGPDFFTTIFNISCVHQTHGISFENDLTIGLPVLATGRDQPYGEVEDAGAQALPAFLRQLADAVEADLHRVAEEREKRTRTSAQ